MKPINNKILGVIVAVFLSLCALTANAHQYKHVNVKRDYKTVVVYTTPDPVVQKIVARKVIAAKKRRVRLIRRTMRAALR
ncbi:MAG: hypothetical protein P8J14_12000 [Emcibacteraceae bacterium]|nr:hypothetical protein [Emcibacteraceae bacterium]